MYDLVAVDKGGHLLAECLALIVNLDFNFPGDRRYIIKLAAVFGLFILLDGFLELLEIIHPQEIDQEWAALEYLRSCDGLKESL